MMEAAPPSEVSVSRTGASAALFVKSLVIGLLAYLFLSITIEVLRIRY